MKRQATEGNKIFAKGLAFKISKELLKLNNTRNNKKNNNNNRNNPIKKRATYLDRSHSVLFSGI